MENDEIFDTTHGTELWQYYFEEINTLLELARQDEREKITEEKVKDYFAGLNGKETALIVLNYLLRGGITDDDLRGLRLQWIKDEREKWKPYLLDSVLTDAEFKEYTGSEREKMQGVDVWVSWDKHKRQEVYPVLTFTEPATESRPSYFTYYKTDDESYATITPKEAKSLGVSPGQCKKLRIVEVGNE